MQTLRKVRLLHNGRRRLVLRSLRDSLYAPSSAPIGERSKGQALLHWQPYGSLHSSAYLGEALRLPHADRVRSCSLFRTANGRCMEW